jgi:hypothetical protein
MILVNTVKNHEEHKKTLLKLIGDFERLHDTKDYTNCSTDFNISQDIERDYLDYFHLHILDDVIESISKQLGLAPCEWDVLMAWFQQYNQSNVHSWHNHAYTQFTNCYFLELPDASHKTEILDINGNILEYDAKEGDIITFPAWMKHRSKPHEGEQKTVIAFNLDFNFP